MKGLNKGSRAPLRIQMKDVVTMARMVPVGIDFWASLRSPERLDPAMIPAEQTGVTVTENLEDIAHSTTHL